ncbi:efflux RND transporter permease subunit [Streptosporangium lutulentum]
MTGGTDDIPVLVLAVSDGGDQRERADTLERVLVPELQGIDGVSEATVTGTRDENVVIVPDAKELAARRLAPTAVADALRANGQSVAAGNLTEDKTSLTVQVGSRITSLQELKDLYLLPPPRRRPVSRRRRRAVRRPGAARAGAASRGGAQAGEAERCGRGEVGAGREHLFDADQG